MCFILKLTQSFLAVISPHLKPLFSDNDHITVYTSSLSAAHISFFQTDYKNENLLKDNILICS